MGKSRSATAVLMYIMKLFSMKLDDAFEYVKTMRDQTEPNSAFLLQLQEYEKQNFSFAQETALLASEPPSPGILGAKLSVESGLTPSPEQIAARYLLGDPVMFQEEKGITIDISDHTKIKLPLRLQHKAESQYETWKGEGYNVIKMDNKNKEFVPNLESTR